MTIPQAIPSVSRLPRKPASAGAVSASQGLSVKLESLLYEISHPYRNWKLIIPELRAFVLKNLNHYRDHEDGPNAFSLFMGIFFDALKDSSKNSELSSRIIEAMLAYTDKLIGSLDAPALFRFEQDFSEFFKRLQKLKGRKRFR